MSERKFKAESISSCPDSLRVKEEQKHGETRLQTQGVSCVADALLMKSKEFKHDHREKRTWPGGVLLQQHEFTLKSGNVNSWNAKKLKCRCVVFSEKHQKSQPQPANCSHNSAATTAFNTEHNKSTFSSNESLN